MLSPLEIQFHNSSRDTDAIESRIRQELAEFEKFYNRLLSCRIDVEAPEHERRGSISTVRIDFAFLPKTRRAPKRVPQPPARTART